MRFTVEDLDLVTTHPFVIARGGGSAFENIVVRVEAGGLVGEGEAHPSAYYGETRATARAALDHLARALPDIDPSALDAGTVGALLDAADAALGRNPAAKAALDGALWDLLGHARGEPVWRLLGLDEAAPVATSFTIAIAEPGAMVERAAAAAAAGRRILKLKAGGEGELAVVERVARELGGEVAIRVDANGAWTAGEALAKMERLAMAGVEFIEQPLAGRDLAGYRAIGGRAPLPVVLDESVREPHDVEVFGEYADGVNLKIAKHGGIARSLAVAEKAREAGLDLMIGCMIESGLGISQGAQLLSLTRWADLDGFLLVDRDPYEGMRDAPEGLRPPAGPGLGVRRRRD